MALNPQYEEIGRGFVQQYYALFDDPTQRPNLVNMYNVSVKLELVKLKVFTDLLVDWELFYDFRRGTTAGICKDYGKINSEFAQVHLDDFSNLWLSCRVYHFKKLIE